MRNRRFALLLFCALTARANNPPPQNHIVVVISLDGFPASALQDPRLPVPTLRRLAREGSAAGSMQPVNPTVTWPNHTTIVTGVTPALHHVLFNGAVRRHPDGTLTIDPTESKDKLVDAVTIYDLAHQAGLKTGQVDWVAIRGSPAIDVEFAEDPDPQGAVSRALIAEGVATEQQLASFDDSSPAWQDLIRTDAAKEILLRDQPNLLMVHLLSLDDMSHAYGPGTQASMAAMAFLDDRVREIVDVLRQPELAGRATVIVVSDHGFQRVEYSIHANAVLRAAGMEQKSADGGETWKAWVLPDGGVAMVYVADAAQRAALIPRLHDLFAQTEGVAQVFGPDELRAIGLPSARESDAAPDLLLAARDGYMFSQGDEGRVVDGASGGTHGYLNADRAMDAIFLAWGNGIRSGVHLDRIGNCDVAPTLAALLGLEMPTSQGRVLREILQESSKATAHE